MGWGGNGGTGGREREGRERGEKEIENGEKDGDGEGKGEERRKRVRRDLYELKKPKKRGSFHHAFEAGVTARWKLLRHICPHKFLGYFSSIPWLGKRKKDKIMGLISKHLVQINTRRDDRNEEEGGKGYGW